VDQLDLEQEDQEEEQVVGFPEEEEGVEEAEAEEGEEEVTSEEDLDMRADKEAPQPQLFFVANLPFAMEDNQLSEIFVGHSVKQAHVVKRPNGRSKGFGFVEFNTQDDQQAALNAAKSKVVNGRELIVKVALSSQDGPGKPEGEGQDAGAPAPASTGAPPASPAPAPAPAANPAPAATPEIKKEEKTGN